MPAPVFSTTDAKARTGRDHHHDYRRATARRAAARR
jgi:hypothetical protein